MQDFGSLHVVDYALIIAYFCVIIFIGIFFKRFIKKSKDYFAAGAAVPWWLAGISLWMASFSALSFVIYPQLAYKYGFVSVTLCWVVVPAMLIAAFFFSAKWRRARVMTPLGFIGQRYNRFVHQLFVWTGIPLRFIDNALRVYSTAIFLVMAIGQSWFTLEVCIVFVGIIMILYTLLGGQWAVLVTDFIQFTVLSLAVLILFPLSIYAVGGFGGLIAKTPEGFFRLLSPPYGAFDWVMFAVLIGISYNATWALVQKYNCVATESDAKKVALTMVGLSSVGFVIFFLPAMAARILLPELGATEDGSKYAYVALSLKILPPGIMGLMVAGMFSATLSTLGSDYNVMSGVLTKDFYGKVIRPDADEKTFIKWGRINTAIIGLITIFCAIGINYIRGLNLYDIMNKATGALGPAVMLPLLGGLIIKKLNSRGAITGVLCGTLSGVGLVIINMILLGVYSDRVEVDATLAYWLKQGYNSLSIGVNVIVTILGMWIGSSLFLSPEKEKVRVKEFFKQMDIPTEPKVEKTLGGRQSPFYAVGIAVMILGFILAFLGIVMKFSGDTKALVLDVLAGGIMFVIGFILWIKTVRRGV